MTGIHQGLMATKSAGPGFLSSSFTQIFSQTLTITKPANVVAGTLMIGLMAADLNNFGSWTGPTGWTEWLDQGAQPNLRVISLVAGASEPANYTSTFSDPTSILSGYILAFERATLDTVGTIATSGGGLACVAPSINCSLPGLILAIYANEVASRTFSTPAGMTALVSDSDVNAPSLAVFSQFSNQGATGTRSSTPSGANQNAGCLVGMV